MRYIFPQINNEAEYDYFSFIISLSNIKRKHLNQISSTEIDIDNVHHFNIISHECTHYLDHIATYKGQQLIIASLESIELIKHPVETEMWKIIKFNKMHKEIFHDSYYKIIDISIKDRDISKWSFGPTVGLRFNRRGRIEENSPILFTRFMFDGKRVARIPISLESIWEANAMYTEIEQTLTQLMKIKDNEVVFNMYNDDYIKRISDYIYNSELLVYSHVAHYVSKEIFEDGDFVTAYMGVKIISGICSNLPEDLYKNLKIPRILFTGNSRARLSRLLKNKDVGLLFLCLVFNYISDYPSLIDRRLHLLQDKFGELLLKSSNLPKKEEIEQLVIRKMEENLIAVNEISKESDFHFKQLELGKQLFEKRGLFNDSIDEIINQENLCDFPIVVEDDLDSIHCERYFEFDEYIKKISEFSTACTY